MRIYVHIPFPASDEDIEAIPDVVAPLRKNEPEANVYIRDSSRVDLVASHASVAVTDDPEIRAAYERHEVPVLPLRSVDETESETNVTEEDHASS